MNNQFLINRGQMQIVSCASQKYLTHCRGCGETVDLVTFAEASEIVNATLDEIINFVATGMVHVAIRPEALLICLKSLVAADFNSSSKKVSFAQKTKGKQPKTFTERFKVRH